MKMATQVVIGTVIHASVACSQSGSDEPQFGTVELNLVLEQTESTATSDDGSAPISGALHASRAMAFVRHIEFYLPEGECAYDAVDAGEHECEDKLRVDGPWVVDLMTGTSTPSMHDIRVPSGSYRRVDVRFEDADKNAVEGINVPDELANWTLVAGGDYIGEVASAFDMRLKFNEDARFQSDAGIVVTTNGAQEMVMALDVERWFSAVSLDECFEKDRLDVVDDTLVIEDESKRCNAIENAIKEAMKHPHRMDD